MKNKLMFYLISCTMPDVCDGMAEIVVSTHLGYAVLFEYADFDFNNEVHLERAESHICAHQIERLSRLFDCSLKPAMMPLRDFLPIDEIMTAAELKINFKI